MKRLLHALAGDSASSLVSAYVEAAKEKGLVHDDATAMLAATLAAAYPALRAQIMTRPDDVIAISRGKLRIARDLRTLRRLAVGFCSDLADIDAVRRGLRLFAQRERLRVAARELLATEGGELETTAREVSDIAQVCLEIATDEALRWAEARFGAPLTATGARCAFVVLGMGKLGGRELNVGSDVDLIPFYETDEGEVRTGDGPAEQSLHEHFMRVTRRLTETLEDVTNEGVCWRVDLRLRPEGSRGPLVNALAAAERYYETWGRTWERAALLRARPVAGDLAFGARVLDALAPFVWRKVVDPKIAREMTELVVRGRAELSSDPDRDLKLGPGGIREAEFFVQSLQLIWGGKEPSLRLSNTHEALRRLRSRGLVTDRESRELEAAYLALRRIEHRVQNATGIQTHVLPRGELLETIARGAGFATGMELEKDLERTRRRVATRFASLTRTLEGPTAADARFAPLLVALDAGDEGAVIAALSDAGGAERPAVDFPDLTASVDLARHLLSLARRPDFPFGAVTRDRHPDLVPSLLEALADAADPEQATRLLAAFFSRLSTPGVYARALAEDRHLIRKLVGLFGASAFLGEALVYHPELVESILFAKGMPSADRARREVDAEIETATMAEALAGDDSDPEDVFVGALRRAKSRIMMEVGLAELSGELVTREATLVLSAAADATLEHATRWALEEKKLEGGLVVVAMGKLGGREIGYGSDLDIFFLYDAGDDEDGVRSERYIRAAQRVLRLVSAPHGTGPGYELDTRLRPSGSQGLLVVSLDAFARYHGLRADGTLLEPSEEGGAGVAQDWERQALVKARVCAGDEALGRRFSNLAKKIAYERGAPDRERLHHLRMRMENELAREGAHRFDVKLGKGGIVDVEFAVQWLQMKYGGDPRVRTSDTETALGALEACGYTDSGVASVLREGYAMLRRLEQALRVVHGTSASLIEEGAPGLAALARRMGFRDGQISASQALIERYRAVTADVRAAYLSVLGV
ncbi:MAG: bifunctional [glutamate--ammonia ligase]-adenylyl-L-tyrosine phosphorylase/[glutamate--ammonia-ligase] adenylyltransferase [Deltaproteobacteria bacterium]|nr:bifunctional [glutamate--ammonia ligase]-adenylyl-L-tyrosine phosphorylase/[glutamate--ammonia-ligase] adenylyltransferase [Deltaproteobacteria bacterium]